MGVRPARSFDRGKRTEEGGPLSTSSAGSVDDSLRESKTWLPNSPNGCVARDYSNARSELSTLGLPCDFWVYPPPESCPAPAGNQVIRRNLRHAVAAADGGAGDVGGHDAVGQKKQRIGRVGRLRIGDIQPGGEDAAGFQGFDQILL